MSLEHLKKHMNKKNMEDQIKLLYCFKNGLPKSEIKSWVSTNIDRFSILNILKSDLVGGYGINKEDYEFSLKMPILNSYEDEFSQLFSHIYFILLANQLEKDFLDAIKDIELKKGSAEENINLADTHYDLFYFLTFKAFSEFDMEDEDFLILGSDPEKQIKLKKEDYSAQLDFIEKYNEIS